METIVLIIGFIIVFGGISYTIMDNINHFSSKA